MSAPEQFDRALEKIAADQSPRDEMAALDPAEQQMVRVAQFIAGSRSEGASPEFTQRLHGRLFSPGLRVSRRTAFVSGLGALAAGLAAGIGLDRAAQGGSDNGAATRIVGANGKWVPVAQVTDIPHGAVHAFSTGAVQGYVMNINGQFRAVSRICTHMGCRLSFERSEQSLLCPCHGAEFELNGQLRHGPGGYNSSKVVPPLPPIDVRVNGSAVEVWAV